MHKNGQTTYLCGFRGDVPPQNRIVCSSALKVQGFYKLPRK